MKDSYPIDNLPQVLVEAKPQRVRKDAEQSAVREAITLVCESGAERLQGWLDKIEAESGAKAAMDSFLKLLEFSQPKLSRVTVQDPDGNASKTPIINVTFHSPAPIRIVDDIDGENLDG
jgi:hypothetical protein